MVDALDFSDRAIRFWTGIPRVFDQSACDPIVQLVLLALAQSAERHRIETHPSAIFPDSGRAYGLSVCLRQLRVGFDGHEDAVFRHGAAYRCFGRRGWAAAAMMALATQER